MCGEGVHHGLIGNVGDERGEAGADRRADLGDLHGLVHRLLRYVADRYVAALGGELAGQFAPHPRATAGDDRYEAFEARNRLVHVSLRTLRV